ncbi:UDP-glucose dehydrogenase family protein [Paenibacillus allorhizosphaerae]|uniref:UDP-glucose 6-dehydrogenase n=1 Tax=Paenibacillus allorhizosphaerae TaxID=2849866 RepID=A0ABN7TMY6_9BACL|nr:UDP-glucose/GDP-mannose dehydrogenase family protein [Paenibacillus allorhizosphaerae]CAG7647776.1 UDP-glucose 6-dehydrogenase YwqF [Paenibacillus allorhizosphaerae]
MKVTVVGSGYVGTTTALVLAGLGHQVIGYDIDAGKVERLNDGELPFTEPGLDQMLRDLLGSGRITFTSDSRSAVTESEILMISVGTPSMPNGGADLTYLRQVLDTIAAHIDGPKIVVTKSTVPIGTNRWMKQRLSDIIDTQKYPVEVISNPEFLREGEALYDSLHPSRTVIGGENESAMEQVKKLYESLQTTYLVCNYETAEMIKYASNGFLAAKISFINEIARLADRVGADIRGVAKGMGMDPRISPHHLYAGIGYGGSCFPKDVDELLYFGSQQKTELHLLRQVKRINDSQIAWFADKMQSILPLEGKRIAVLGVAFKENTDDQRESPGIKMIEQLLGRGVQEIRVIDPTVASLEQIHWSKGFDRTQLSRVGVLTDAREAVAGAHAVVLATPWPQFADYPWEEWAQIAESTYFFDGRNYLDPVEMRSKGWHFTGIARGETT